MYVISEFLNCYSVILKFADSYVISYYYVTVGHATLLLFTVDAVYYWKWKWKRKEPHVANIFIELTVLYD